MFLDGCDMETSKADGMIVKLFTLQEKYSFIFANFL